MSGVRCAEVGAKTNIKGQKRETGLCHVRLQSAEMKDASVSGPQRVHGGLRSGGTSRSMGPRESSTNQGMTIGVGNMPEHGTRNTQRKRGEHRGATPLRPTWREHGRPRTNGEITVITTGSLYEPPPTNTSKRKKKPKNGD